jgi:threonine dehydratase
MFTPGLDAIRDARARLVGQIHRTPVFSSTTLARATGTTGFTLKCESLQKTGSFKVRGALNAVKQLDAASRDRGVVTVSAGNHGQALAWAARAADAPCTVVMPEGASASKVAATRGYGAEVILHGTAAEAFERASELARGQGLTLVHPFDDPNVITGQGTVGLELLEQVPDVEVVVVPIGGGGLISGIASAVKQQNPSVQVFGVEPEGAAAMRDSLRAGHPVRLQGVQTIADGLAAPFAGDITFPIVQRFVDDVVVVSDEMIASAMSQLLVRTKLLAEPAGAAATAALLARCVPGVEGKRVAVLVSGGNVDLSRLCSLVSDE